MKQQAGTIAAFLGSLATFLATGAEVFSQHRAFSEFYTTTSGMGHMFLLGASFVAMLSTALYFQPPRSNAQHGDRASDPPADSPADPPANPPSPPSPHKE